MVICIKKPNMVRDLPEMHVNSQDSTPLHASISNHGEYRAMNLCVSKAPSISIPLEMPWTNVGLLPLKVP